MLLVMTTMIVKHINIIYGKLINDDLNFVYASFSYVENFKEIHC